MIYLAFGSNLGNKTENIKSAINKLSEYKIKFLKIAPLYENPAFLTPESDDEFNIPYYNTVAEIETDLNPFELLALIKKIESELDRDLTIKKKYASRTIDIDIIKYHDVVLCSDQLTIPHKEFLNRPFVLSPFSYLNPEILSISKKQKFHIPVLMGIVNITNDSFSGDGLYHEDDIINKIDNLLSENIGIIDIGAESTRPNAITLDSNEEIQRLLKIFKIIKEKSNNYFTKFSIDTYHYETAKVAIESGFKIINNVGGLNDSRMLNLLKLNPDVEMILMHNLSIPADPNIILNKSLNPISEIKNWIKKIELICEKNNIDKSKIIIDPGIGFGKNKFQSLKIIQNIKEITKSSFRILIGHSRKSFMNIFASNIVAQNKDIETIAISLQLMNSGVDILRVHNIKDHKRALIAYMHALK